MGLGLWSLTTNTHSGRDTLGASLHPPYWTKHLQRRVCNPDAACHPAAPDPCRERPLNKWCGGLWPWFRKPLVHLPYSHENLQPQSLTEHLECQHGCGWQCTTPSPSAGLCRESSAWSLRPQGQVLRSRQGSVVLHVGVGCWAEPS